MSTDSLTEAERLAFECWLGRGDFGDADEPSRLMQAFHAGIRYRNEQANKLAFVTQMAVIPQAEPESADDRAIRELEELGFPYDVTFRREGQGHIFLVPYEIEFGKGKAKEKVKVSMRAKFVPGLDLWVVEGDGWFRNHLRDDSLDIKTPLFRLVEKIVGEVKALIEGRQR